MSLYLSDRNLDLLRGLQGLILTPLDYPDTPSWTRAVIDGLADVLGTDRITMLVASGGGIVQESHPVLEPFHDAIAGMARPGPTGVAFRAEQLDRAFRARRRRGWNVWSNRMLEEHADESLQDQIQLVALPLLANLGRRTGHDLARAGSREISIEGIIYVLRPALLRAGTVLPGRPAVLVLVERRTPRLPSARTLIARFGLTQREAQIALLLATGLSNRDLAERLGISPSTVRTHTEHIFDKLAIRTRKALALRLLGGEAS